AAHLVERARPVGVAAGVAQVDEVLGRQEVDQRTGHGEATEAAVEHPDRPVVHTTRLRRRAPAAADPGRALDPPDLGGAARARPVSRLDDPLVAEAELLGHPGAA